MKLKVSENNLTPEMIKVLMDSFNYSIEDIGSYDELTDKEKEFIPRKLFEEMT